MLHSVFGLGLQCDRAVPGLAACPVLPRVDVRIELGALPPWLDRLRAASPAEPWYVGPDRDERGEPILRGWKLAGGYVRLRYEDGAEFIVDRPGDRVWAIWPPGLTLEDASAYLLGPVLGLVLRLRGVPSLHASAVVVAGHVIAFVGPGGAGKSTAAAMLAGRGCPVLSDDLVTLRDDGGRCLVAPGFPWLRLRPESAALLYDPVRAQSLLRPTVDKRYLDLDLTRDGHRWEPEPRPLGAVYLLDGLLDGPRADAEGRRAAAGPADWSPDRPRVEVVPARDALMTLVANTWATRLTDGAARVRELRLLGRVVGQVPVRRVRATRGPGGLARLSDEILG